MGRPAVACKAQCRRQLLSRPVRPTAAAPRPGRRLLSRTPAVRLAVRPPRADGIQQGLRGWALRTAPRYSRARCPRSRHQVLGILADIRGWRSRRRPPALRSAGRWVRPDLLLQDAGCAARPQHLSRAPASPGRSALADLLTWARPSPSTLSAWQGLMEQARHGRPASPVLDCRSSPCPQQQAVLAACTEFADRSRCWVRSRQAYSRTAADRESTRRASLALGAHRLRSSWIRGLASAGGRSSRGKLVAEPRSTPKRGGASEAVPPPRLRRFALQAAQLATWWTRTIIAMRLGLA